MTALALKNKLTPYPEFLLETKIARNSTIRHLQQLKESEHQLDCQSYVDPHQNRCLFGGTQNDIGSLSGFYSNFE
jgi:hypothetical protein